MKSKSPILAAALNILPVLGIGYLYLGKYLRFAVVFLFQFFLGKLIFGEYFLTVAAVLWLFSILDAYDQAKKLTQPTV